MFVDNTKICTDCGLDKSFEYYSIQKRGRFGLSPTCKECASKRNKMNRERNRNRDAVTVPLTKFCPNCELEKVATLFLPFPTNKDGLYFICNECDKTRGKIRRRKNADREAIEVPLSKKCYSCNLEKLNSLFSKDCNAESGLASQCKECSKNRMMLWNYGVGLEWYNATLAAQGGGCKICFTKNPGGRFSKTYHVDHEHVEGWDEMPPEERRLYVRGLLCANCNLLLGYARDSVQILQNTISYLNKYNNEAK